MEPVTITMSEGRFIDIDFVQWILNEVEDKVFTRADVAHTYAILIQKDQQEWHDINAAILKRWSKSGLLWIKREAWKQISEQNEQSRNSNFELRRHSG